MMTSKNSSEESRQGFDLDIQSTPEDVSGHRRARELGQMSFAEYLEVVSREHASIEELAKRKLPIGYEPFKL